MDKLTAIKIKHPNGQYSDPILLSVKADNVQYDDTRGLKDKIQEMESRVNDILTPTPGSTSFDQEIEDARKGTDIDPATGERIDYGSLYSSITTQYAKSLNTVLVRETQPTEKENKLWIDKSTSGDDEVQVLTIDDLDIIAPVYNENSTYTAGDYVVYDGSLYRCNVDIETAEPWDSTHWVSTNISEKLIDIDKTLTVAGMAADAEVVGDEIGDLKSALDSLKVSMVLDLSDIRNVYQRGTIGNVVSFPTTSSTKTIVHAISVRSGQTYTINAKYGSAVFSTNQRICACVDDSDVIIQTIQLQVTANSINTATFKALHDGFLNVSVDSKYESIEIIGLDPNAATTVQKSVDANSEKIEEIKTEVQDTKVKAKLISCLRNMGWVVGNGYYYLLAFCEAIGVDGWVDVKPKTSIDSTTGNTVNENVWRQATYFIDVGSYTSIKSDFADSDNYKPYYIVRCYNSEKEYIGTAKTSDNSAGIIIGTTARFFPQNTSYIRLLLAPNTSADTNLDLIGVYTGRVLELTLTGSNQATTKRKYALVEVEDFSDV